MLNGHPRDLHLVDDHDGKCSRHLRACSIRLTQKLRASQRLLAVAVMLLTDVHRYFVERERLSAERTTARNEAGRPCFTLLLHAKKLPWGLANRNGRRTPPLSVNFSRACFRCAQHHDRGFPVLVPARAAELVLDAGRQVGKAGRMLRSHGRPEGLRVIVVVGAMAVVGQRFLLGIHLGSRSCDMGTRRALASCGRSWRPTRWRPASMFAMDALVQPTARATPSWVTPLRRRARRMTFPIRP